MKSKEFGKTQIQPVDHLTATTKTSSGEIVYERDQDVFHDVALTFGFATHTEGFTPEQIRSAMFEFAVVTQDRPTIESLLKGEHIDLTQIVTHPSRAII